MAPIVIDIEVRQSGFKLPRKCKTSKSCAPTGHRLTKIHL